jgi:hypothetical protein
MIKRANTYLYIILILLCLALAPAGVAGLHRQPAAPRPSLSGREVFATSSTRVDAPRSIASTDMSVESIAKNVEVVGHIGGDANAIFVQGNYVYISFGPALAIVDVSDPSHPVQRGYIVLPGMVQDIFVAGSYAYIAANDAGLRVVDISDPNTPKEVGAYDTPRAALRLAVEGSYGYVILSACRPDSANFCSRGLTIMSLLNPTMPVEVGSYDTEWLDTKDVVVAGHYAYIANSTGLTTIDISNPAAPTLVGSTLLDEGAFVDQIAVSGSYVYLGGDKLWIISISNPAKPIKVGTYNSPAAGIAVVDRFAYITDEGLSVVNISKPSKPMKVGFYATPGENRRVAVAGNYAYLAAGSKGLRVVSVANPAAPIEIGFYDPPRAHSANGVVVAGDYAYVIDVQFVQGNRYGTLHLVDISNPAHPVIKGFYDKLEEPQDVAVVGSYAYIADGGRGLRVIDVSNPAAPAEVGFLDTPGDAQSVTIAGQYAYVAAGSLQIIDISNPSAPVAVALSNIPAVDVAVVDQRAYIAAGSEGLRIVDVSEPAAPREVGAYSILQGAASQVVVAAGYAYLSWGNCVVGANYVLCWGGVEVVSIANPTPIRVGSYFGDSWALGMTIVGSHVYLAHGLRGLRMIHVSIPSAPTEVGFYNTPFYARDVAAANGYLYVADTDGGLFILRASASIAGRITDVNGTPFSGVSLVADPNLTTTSDTAGNYMFPKLSPGTHTLRPALSGYAFYPPSSTITIPPDAIQNFTILPAPVSITLRPNVGTNLTYTDTQGLPTILTFPAGAVTQTTSLTVTPTLGGQRPGYAFAGHAFDLTASQTGAIVPNFSFSQPVTATIRYSDADIRVIADEQELILWQWIGSGWQDAAQSCVPAATYARDVARNTLSVGVCRSGAFALFGPTHQIYLPLAPRDRR